MKYVMQNAFVRYTKFKKESGCDYISDKLWVSMPDKIKEAVYNKLLEISNLTSWEIQNL